MKHKKNKKVPIWKKSGPRICVGKMLAGRKAGEQDKACYVHSGPGRSDPSNEKSIKLPIGEEKIRTGMVWHVNMRLGNAGLLAFSRRQQAIWLFLFRVTLSRFLTLVVVVSRIKICRAFHLWLRTFISSSVGSSCWSEFLSSSKHNAVWHLNVVEAAAVFFIMLFPVLWSSDH